ncbi:PKD domain-containing protein [Pseudoalteromonas denitrificans]|uniref:PKD domain-containing protein n=1 Tax=Pseudoalteromonas denitrificans DSM 6059 TaxID=1123010 RepID=A0A1I1KJI5_9GAMM|nr:PKD domain-containing protein [Pseudoalteromonas denitrificans]SFC58838.1 hypothetical protein SAMN02745724_02047 [Pseudoalteromonas denitrificans DSM 6059]
MLSHTMFKKLVIKVFVVLVTLIMPNSILASPTVTNDVRAVFVGHSLINYDMPYILQQLTQDAQNLTMQNAVQVMNGAPLRYNWDFCTESSFTGQWPPESFACDAIEAGTVQGAYNTLIVTDANNSIHSNHEWNHPQLHINNFLELMKNKDPQSRAFFYTSWEALDYHTGEWTDAIAFELAEYEEIIAQAKQISADLGRHAEFELIPANLALRELILQIESGQISGLSQRADIFADNVHMNNLGNYFMANVVFSAIFKRSPVGLTNQVNAKNGVNIHVDSVLAQQLQALAWQVVSNYYSDDGQVNQAPNGEIIAPLGTQTITKGSHLTFSALASDPDSDEALTYLWDFDGVAPVQTSLTSSSILFDQVGVFDIQFLVTDSLGLSDTTPAIIQIMVEDDSSIDISPNEKSALGVNLTGLSYWSTQWMMLDVMKQASNGNGEIWATSNAQTYVFNTGHQSRLDLDDQGWPKALPPSDDPDFHFVSTIIYQDNQDYAVGEYVVLYEGEGELNYNGATKITNKSSKGRDIVQLNENAHFHLQIRQTDPHKTGNHLRNIRIIVPGGICGTAPTAYSQEASDCVQASDFNRFEQIYRHQNFHPLFLEDMKKYRSIRFMQMMNTNVSEQYTWSDRAKFDFASWAMPEGSPLELAIDLANKTQAEPWLNVPARVDDDYMRQYARLVKNTLDTHLNVIIELGNEVWNNAYPYNQDANWMEQQGRLLWPGANVSSFEFRLNYYGKRTSDMCEIFKQEFAEQANRVKCTVASQGGNVWVGEQILECKLWAEQNNGQNCAVNIDSLAIGPYFGGYLYQDKFVPLLKEWADEGVLGLTKLFDEINSGILRDLTYDPTEPDWVQAPIGGALLQTKGFIEQNKLLANRFGLKLTAYEGGQHLTFAGNLAGDRSSINDNIFIAGNRVQAMGDAFNTHFHDWKNAGGSLYMVFESTAKWGAFGAFPLKEYQQQPMNETPKLASTLAFIDSNPCWWEGCDRMTHHYGKVQIDDLPDVPQVGSISLTSEVRLDSWGVALSWSEIDGVQYYQIFRDDVFVGHTNADIHIFNNDWLELHREYHFQIKAVDSNDNVIAESNILTSLAGDSIAPTQVTGLSAIFNGQYGFELNWTASIDAGGVNVYVIYRNGEPFTNVTETRLVDDWPPQGAVTYQVFAHDTVGNISQGSDIITAQIPSTEFLISAMTRPENRGVALNWSFTHSDIKYFKIFRDNVFVGHTNADGTHFNNDWLELGIDYFFVVIAVDEQGNIILESNTVSLQAGDSQAPSKPENLKVTFDGAYGFNISWNESSDNTGVDYYKIKRNGEDYTTRNSTQLIDEWPPEGDVSYQIFAVDKYHNISPASVIVTGSRP